MKRKPIFLLIVALLFAFSQIQTFAEPIENVIKKTDENLPESRISENELYRLGASLEEQSGNFYYTVNTDGTATITRYSSTVSGNLSIPQSLNGHEVTAIGEYAFSNRDDLTGSLIIPDTVKTVESHAFSWCEGFTGLSLGDNIVEIGEDAFGGCSGFAGNLVIPNSVNTIADGAFYGCSFDGTLTIGNKVTAIGKNAFTFCEKFTGSLIIPDSVITIGDEAFTITHFTSLKLGNNVTTIGKYAFNNITNLTGTITIPNKVNVIGDYAFCGCSGFTGNLTIPTSVTEIGSHAFFGCEGLTSLSIPNTVTSIGESAFANCSGFTGSLIIPNSITEIREETFFDCYHYTGDLTIPEGVTSIGKQAFWGCYGFDGTLTIPESVTSINEDAFELCTEIKRVVNNSSVPVSLLKLGIDDRTWRNEATGEIITSIAKGVAVRDDYKNNNQPDEKKDSISDNNSDSSENTNTTVSDNSSESSNNTNTTISDNKAMDYSFDIRDNFSVGYNHSVPFWGKSKPTVTNFGDITISYNGIEYKVTKVKINKKKHLIQIIGLEGADKDIVKAIKKATKGASGLSFKVNPYYVKNTDKVMLKTKKDGSIKSIKVSIFGKDYKVKKDEWTYDKGNKTVFFKGNNLTGSYLIP